MKFTSYDIKLLRPEIWEQCVIAHSLHRFQDRDIFAIYDNITFEVDYRLSIINDDWKQERHLVQWNRIVEVQCEYEFNSPSHLQVEPLVTVGHQFTNFKYYGLVKEIRLLYKVMEPIYKQNRKEILLSVDDVVLNMLKYIHQFQFQTNWESFSKLENLYIWNKILGDRIELLMIGPQ